MTTRTGQPETVAATRQELTALKAFIDSGRVSAGDGGGVRESWLMSPWWWYLKALHLSLIADDKTVSRKTHQIRRTTFLREKERLGRPPTVDDVRRSLPEADIGEEMTSLLARDLQIVSQPVRRRTRDEVLAERLEKLARKLSKSKPKTAKKGGKR